MILKKMMFKRIYTQKSQYSDLEVGDIGFSGRPTPREILLHLCCGVGHIVEMGFG
jgi:hypothetical protein